MTRKNTTHRKSRTLARALAALAVVLGAGLFTSPARADGPHFSFSFSAPFPFPVPVYEPPRYYEPAPPVYYEEPAPPVYYDEPAPRAYYEPPVVYAPPPVYVERPVSYGYYGRPYYGHHDHGRHRGWDHH